MNQFQLTGVKVEIIGQNYIISNVSLVDFTTIIAHTTAFSPPTYTFFDEESCVLSVKLSPLHTIQTVLIANKEITVISKDFNLTEDKSVILYL